MMLKSLTVSALDTLTERFKDKKIAPSANRCEVQTAQNISRTRRV